MYEQFSPEDRRHIAAVADVLKPLFPPHIPQNIIRRRGRVTIPETDLWKIDGHALADMATMLSEGHPCNVYNFLSTEIEPEDDNDVARERKSIVLDIKDYPFNTGQPWSMEQMFMGVYMERQKYGDEDVNPLDALENKDLTYEERREVIDSIEELCLRGRSAENAFDIMSRPRDHFCMILAPLRAESISGDKITTFRHGPGIALKVMPTIDKATIWAIPPDLYTKPMQFPKTRKGIGKLPGALTVVEFNNLMGTFGKLNDDSYVQRAMQPPVPHDDENPLAAYYL